MLLMNFPYKIPVGLEVILFTIARYYTSHEFPIQNTHRPESDIFYYCPLSMAAGDAQS